MNFLNSNLNNGSERDIILHSLIENTIAPTLKKADILEIANLLEKYRKKNGYDAAIDIFYIKLLKKCNDLKLSSSTNEMTSQYHIALKCFENKNALPEFYGQKNNIINGKNVVIRGIKLSNVFTIKLAKLFMNFINKDYLLKNTVIIEKNDEFVINVITKLKADDIIASINNKSKIPFYQFKYLFYNKIEMSQIYDEFKKGMYQYLSLDFWAMVAFNELLTDFTINAGNDTYLLNAGACLCYKSRSARVKYDLCSIQLPEKITLEVNRLIQYQICFSDLLEYKTDLQEVKNLCSLVYIMYIEEKSIESLLEYATKMNPIGLIILILVYSNYIKYEIPVSFIQMYSDFLEKNECNDFLLIRYFYIIIASKKNYSSYIPNKLLYLAPKSFYLDNDIYTLENTLSLYGIAKKAISKGKLSIFDKFSDSADFTNFLDKILNFVDSKTKKLIILKYKTDLTNVKVVSEIITIYIDENEFSSAYQILEQVKPSRELIVLLKSISMIKKIKKLLMNVDLNIVKYETLEKLEITSILTYDEKYQVFYNRDLNSRKIKITRSTILRDSMKEFACNDMENRKIIVEYICEKGIDQGGLAKDWFTSITSAILESNALIKVPNGDKLTFNCSEDKDKENIYFFIGQLIGIAFANKRNINLKLTSFIWKKILNHEITIDDMKDYDTDIYNSLEYILSNDVTDCGLTFVNSNDDELVKNGRNIEVDNENKENYVKLIINDMLIKPFENEIMDTMNGFRAITGNKKIELFYSSEEFKNAINGIENIDINDWKKNTSYNSIYGKHFNMFFNVISKWTNEKQRKLLKFVTGSSQIPIGGFNGFANIGGLFHIYFYNDKNYRLPSAHTCSNQLDIPCYENEDKYEEALSIAVECNEFGFN